MHMEFVYVVPRQDLFPECYPQGLVSFGPELSRETMEAAIREHGFFVEREVAERTPAWKQIIPYTLFLVDGEVLVLERLSKGGEKRLQGKLSIGVGGHINPEDLEDPLQSGAEADIDPLLAGTHREIEEELHVQGSYELRTIGLLNDDSNPVGAVHLGLVQVAVVEGSVEIREKEVLEGRLVTPGGLADLHSQGANFETWSSMLIERLDELITNPQAMTTG